MVAADDPDLQFLLDHALEAEQLEAVFVDTASAGLDALDGTGQHFDCVVLDLMLPDSEGPETIRTFAQATIVPIVIVSGLVDLDLIAEARRIGVVDYIVKSWDTPDRLGAAINAVIESRHAHLDPAPDFDDAFADTAEDLLADLNTLVPMHQWLLTRRLDHGWTVICSQGDPLIDASRRIDTDDPLAQLVPTPGQIEVGSVEPLATVLDPTQTRIRGYIAAPITTDNHGLYGSLIGLTANDRIHLPASTRRWLHTLVRCFEGTVQVELARTRIARRARVATVAASLDILTRLGNRRAWEHAIAVEESRCARYGHGATIACVDLDRLKTLNDRRGHAAGDQLLRHTANVLRHTIRGSDSAYRVGGDEFTVLSVETEPDHCNEVRDRLQTALTDAGIAASVGVAYRHAQTTLIRAWRNADTDMYRHKNSRRQTRSPAHSTPNEVSD